VFFQIHVFVIIKPCSVQAHYTTQGLDIIDLINPVLLDKQNGLAKERLTQHQTVDHILNHLEILKDWAELLLPKVLPVQQNFFVGYLLGLS
jgi:hypothetical protein